MRCLAVCALLVVAVLGRLRLVVNNEQEQPVCIGAAARSRSCKVAASGKADNRLTRALKSYGRRARIKATRRRSSSRGKPSQVPQLPSPNVDKPDSTLQSSTNASHSIPICALSVTSALEAALTGCHFARLHRRRKQQSAGRGDTGRMHIVLLTCTRVKLLTLVLRSIESIAAPSRIRLQIWVDKPENNTVSRSSVLSLVHAIDTQHVWPGVKVVVFERHMGTRALWLTALSIRRPQLILEDDVVLLPGAFQWYMWSIKVMSTRHDIFGSSFHRQTQVALKNRVKETQLDSAVPYTYPMVGSHGFMLSMDAHDDFFTLLHTRKQKDLYSSSLEGFISTTWYRNLMRQNRSEEQMWTQEMVLFAFKKNKTALYPPTNDAFAVHCARRHTDDQVSGRWPCVDSALLNNTTPLFSRADWVAPVFNWSGISRLDWGAACLRHCRPTQNNSTPTMLNNRTIRPLLTKLRREIDELLKSALSTNNPRWEPT